MRSDGWRIWGTWTGRLAVAVIALGMVVSCAGRSGLDGTATRPVERGVDERCYRPAVEMQEVLDDLKVHGNELDNMTAQRVPAMWMKRELAAGHVQGRIVVGSVRDVCIPARNHVVPVRMYMPADKWMGSGGKLPVVVYVHGGGWTLGSIATYESLARELANAVGAMVISVDYRLAPEHPFPAGLDDVYTAVLWVGRNAEELGVDAQRVAIAGDSGGATLATATVLRVLKEGGPAIAMQVLFYPSTDIARTDYPSYRQYGTGFLLTKRAVESFREFYLPDRNDWTHAYASPLRAVNTDLERMPRTLVVTAGCDPLRDEGEAYARRLRENGVAVTYRVEEDMIHGYLGFMNSAKYEGAAKAAKERLGMAADILRKHLAAR